MNNVNLVWHGHNPTLQGWAPFQAEIIYPKTALYAGRYEKFIHKSNNMVSVKASMEEHYRAVEKLVFKANCISAKIWDNRVNRAAPVVLHIIENTIEIDVRWKLDFLQPTFSFDYLNKLAESFSKPIEQDVKELEQLFVKDYEFYTKNI